MIHQQLMKQREKRLNLLQQIQTKFSNIKNKILQ